MVYLISRSPELQTQILLFLFTGLLGHFNFEMYSLFLPTYEHCIHDTSMTNLFRILPNALGEKIVSNNNEERKLFYSHFHNFFIEAWENDSRSPEKKQMDLLYVLHKLSHGSFNSVHLCNKTFAIWFSAISRTPSGWLSCSTTSGCNIWELSKWQLHIVLEIVGVVAIASLLVTTREGCHWI